MRLARWAYVLGHEMTHAIAAWTSGGKVFAMHVAEDGGHVDVSKSSIFVALAPYCIPFYSIFVVIGYRTLIWAKPSLHAQSLFLLLMGASLAFHTLMTWDTLTEAKQPDLKEAGGAVFSLSIIGITNGLMLLFVLKLLFPKAVGLNISLHQAVDNATWMWMKIWSLFQPTGHYLWHQIYK